MFNFVQSMRLKGMAEEDVYFARRDRELVEALRKKRRQAASSTESSTEPAPNRRG